MPHLGLGAFWQGVTGGVEAGETLSEAAGRELAEETGLAPERLVPIDYSYSFPIQKEWRILYDAGVDDLGCEGFDLLRRRGGSSRAAAQLKR